MTTPFQRMNFFKGYFTHAEDWKQEQAYHIEARRLHQRCLHSPGVVSGALREFQVSAKDGAITVEPGYALDGQGRELYQPDAVVVPVEPASYQDAKAIYIYVSYGEELADRRVNDLNPEYSGYAYVRERPKVSWSLEPPDNEERIEIARIRIRKGARISPDDIDRQHVCFVGKAILVPRVIKPGEIQVSPSKTPIYSHEDPSFWIETFSMENLPEPVAYVANVFPVEPSAGTRIHWRIESLITEKGELEYRLYIKNFGTKPVNVRCRIYRFQFGL